MKLENPLFSVETKSSFGCVIADFWSNMSQDKQIHYNDNLSFKTTFVPTLV